MNVIPPALLVATTTGGSADPLEPTYARHGRLIVTQFVAAPFPHPSRATGHKYKDKVFPAEQHYRDGTVAIGKIILSGHSGGYRVIAAILDRGGLTDQVEEVWLFDALYAEADRLPAWWERKRGRLLNIRALTRRGSDSVRSLMPAATPGW